MARVLGRRRGCCALPTSRHPAGPCRGRRRVCQGMRGPAARAVAIIDGARRMPHRHALADSYARTTEAAGWGTTRALTSLRATWSEREHETGRAQIMRKRADRFPLVTVRAGLALLCAALAAAVLADLPSLAQTSNSVKVASAGIASDIGFFLADKKGYFAAVGLY